jgi:hypothetical protein
MIATAVHEQAAASEMIDWKVIYIQNDSDSVVCFDPEIDEKAQEIICYGGAAKQEPFDLAINIIGSMTLLFSALIILVFIAHKLRKQPRSALYADQNTNLMLGWAFLTYAMLAAAFVENWWT